MYEYTTTSLHQGRTSHPASKTFGYFSRLVVSVLALSLVFVSCQDDDNTMDSTVYELDEVDEIPRFPGCENMELTAGERDTCALYELLTYVYTRTVYPPEAKENNTEGTVVVCFVIDEDGRITDPEIVEDIGDGCGEVVLKIIQGMNDDNLIWISGMIEGASIKTRLCLPVKFEL